MRRFKWMVSLSISTALLFFLTLFITWSTEPAPIYCAATSDGPPAMGQSGVIYNRNALTSSGGSSSDNAISPVFQNDQNLVAESNDEQNTSDAAMTSLSHQHPLVVRMKYLRAEEAKRLLTVLVYPEQIRVEPTNNMLIILARDDQYENIKALLEKVDIPPRQVMFEAEIVEISLNDSKETGISWGDSTTVPSAQDTSGAYRIKFGPNSEDYAANVQATIHHLIETKKGRILASPRIAALDGKTASIGIGDKLAVQTTEVTSGSTITSVSYVEVYIKLEITPSVNDDGTITTHLKPEVSNTTSYDSSGNPNVRTRQAETTLRVKDGETIVLGGLIQRETSKDSVKVPVLGDIPLVGSAFRSTKTSNKTTELVILITPKIVQ